MNVIKSDEPNRNPQHAKNQIQICSSKINELPLNLFYMGVFFAIYENRYKIISNLKVNNSHNQIFTNLWC